MKYPALTRSLILLLTLVTGPLSGQSTIKIMPLGNSMTEGWMDGSEPESKRKAYRYDLKQLLQSSGYDIDFVGSESTGCYYFSDCQNAGIGGTRDQYLERMLIDGYDERWGEQKTTGPYLDAFNPDIILLSIGTNDITHETDAISNQRVSAILNQIDLYEARAHKEVTVFLSLIINRRLLSNGNQPLNYYSTHQWNLAIKAMAEQRIANGDKIVIVNMEEEAGINYGYYAGDMCITDPEGLHPSEVGYSKMASLWYQKFIENYNQAPAISPIPDQTISEGNSFTSINLDGYVSDIEDADQYLSWTAIQAGTSNLNISITNRVATVTVKDANWNGTQTVIFTVTDRGHAGIGTKADADTVVFKVNAVDDPPVITSQSTLATVEDTPLTLTLSDFTITDPDSDPSTFHLVVLPGTNYTASGTKITPAANFSGTLTVNTAVSDVTSTGPAFSVTVTVSSVNDAPAFTEQPVITINEDHSYVADIENFTVSDPDNSKEELTLVLLPGLHYTIENETVYPDTNFNGSIFVESYLQDPLEAVSDVFYIEITVNPVNDAPAFASVPLDSVNIRKQYIYSIQVADPDEGDNLSVTIPVKPSWLVYYENSKLLAGIPPDEADYINNIAISVSDGQSVILQTYVLRVIGGRTGTDQTTQEKFSVFPNPAKNYITVKTDVSSGDISFRLFTDDGRIVFTELLQKGQTTLYFKNELQPGVYIYTIEAAGKVMKGKLLIE